MSTAMDKKKAREAERELARAKREQERIEKEAQKQAKMHEHLNEKIEAAKAAQGSILKLKEWMTHIPYESTDDNLKLETYKNVIKALSAVDNKEYSKVCESGNFDVNDAADLLKYISKAMARSSGPKEQQCKFTVENSKFTDLLKLQLEISNAFGQRVILKSAFQRDEVC